MLALRNRPALATKVRSTKPPRIRAPLPYHCLTPLSPIVQAGQRHAPARAVAVKASRGVLQVLAFREDNGSRKTQVRPKCTAQVPVSGHQQSSSACVCALTTALCL
jgi:hypothetical protein